MKYYSALKRSEVCVYCDVHACAQLLSQVWLCDLIDGSPPGSSVDGIFQARILQWVAISSSRGSSRPRNQTWVSCISYTDRPVVSAGKPVCVCVCAHAHVNWNIVTLQCCASFCYMTVWISYMCIYLSFPLEPPSHPHPIPPRSSQSTKLSFLWYIAASHQLSILHMVACLCESWSPNSSQPPLPPCVHVCSLHLHLYSCRANSFISTIFLDSIYMH